MTTCSRRDTSLPREDEGVKRALITGIIRQDGSDISLPGTCRGLTGRKVLGITRWWTSCLEYRLYQAEPASVPGLDA